MPTFCPLMDRNFATIQNETEGGKQRAEGAPAERQLRSRHGHAARAEDSTPRSSAPIPGCGRFVTGDRDDIDQWASRFGVSVSRAMNDPRDITHNLRTAIIDRQGNLVQIYTGNEWTPDQVLADVHVMVGVD